MSTSFYRDKVQKLQQIIDKKDEIIQHLENELLLCKESKKTIQTEEQLRKWEINTTPTPKYEQSSINRMLKGKDKAMIKFTEKKR